MTMSHLLHASLLLSAVAPALAASRAATVDGQVTVDASLLRRRYVAGEAVGYRMRASNEDRGRKVTYEAEARGVVTRDTAGRFVEEFAWSSVSFDGVPVELGPEAAAFKQPLSLSPGFPLRVPDLRTVLDIVGPITDLLTFYADMKIVNEGGALRATGDGFYVTHGKPASWADGVQTLHGEDSVDFAVSLERVDDGARTATVLVRHVVPARPQVTLKAEWMREPVADTPNNWTQVQRRPDGKFVGGMGQETFESRMTISLDDGRIVRATLSNPVELVERVCDDAELTRCGKPVRSRLLRRIELTSI
jgi:hypothetical protein